MNKDIEKKKKPNKDLISSQNFPPLPNLQLISHLFHIILLRSSTNLQHRNPLFTSDISRHVTTVFERGREDCPRESSLAHHDDITKYTL